MLVRNREGDGGSNPTLFCVVLSQPMMLYLFYEKRTNLPIFVFGYTKLGKLVTDQSMPINKITFYTNITYIYLTDFKISTIYFYSFTTIVGINRKDLNRLNYTYIIYHFDNYLSLARIFSLQPHF